MARGGFMIAIDPDGCTKDHQSLRQLIMREETQLLDVRKIHRLDVVAVKAHGQIAGNLCDIFLEIFYDIIWLLKCCQLKDDCPSVNHDVFKVTILSP